MEFLVEIVGVKNFGMLFVVYLFYSNFVFCFFLVIIYILLS